MTTNLLNRNRKQSKRPFIQHIPDISHNKIVDISGIVSLWKSNISHNKIDISHNWKHDISHNKIDISHNKIVDISGIISHYHHHYDISCIPIPIYHHHHYDMSVTKIDISCIQLPIQYDISASALAGKINISCIPIHIHYHYHYDISANKQTVIKQKDISSSSTTKRNNK